MNRVKRLTWKQYLRLVELIIGVLAIIAIIVYTTFNISFIFIALFVEFFIGVHTFRLWRVFPSDQRRVEKESYRYADAVIESLAKKIPPSMSYLFPYPPLDPLFCIPSPRSLPHSPCSPGANFSIRPPESCPFASTSSEVKHPSFSAAPPSSCLSAPSFRPEREPESLSSLPSTSSMETVAMKMMPGTVNEEGACPTGVVPSPPYPSSHLLSSSTWPNSDFSSIPVKVSSLPSGKTPPSASLFSSPTSELPRGGVGNSFSFSTVPRFASSSPFRSRTEEEGKQRWGKDATVPTLIPICKYRKNETPMNTSESIVKKRSPLFEPSSIREPSPSFFLEAAKEKSEKGGGKTFQASLSPCDVSKEGLIPAGPLTDLNDAFQARCVSSFAAVTTKPKALYTPDTITEVEEIAGEPLTVF